MGGVSNWAADKLGSGIIGGATGSRPNFTRGNQYQQQPQYQQQYQQQQMPQQQDNFEAARAALMGLMGGYPSPQTQAYPQGNNTQDMFQSGLQQVLHKGMGGGQPGYSQQPQQAQIAKIQQAQLVKQQPPTTQNYYDLPGINPNYKPQATAAPTPKPGVTPENQKLAMALKGNTGNSKLASVQKSMPFLFGG